MSKLSEKIKTVRETKKLSQVEFAKAIGFDNASVISNWESGKREPSRDVLLRIANFGEVSLDVLLNDERSFEINLKDNSDNSIHSTFRGENTGVNFTGKNRGEVTEVNNFKCSFSLEAIQPIIEKALEGFKIALQSKDELIKQLKNENEFLKSIYKK